MYTNANEPAGCFQTEVFGLLWEKVGKEGDLMANCETDSGRRERVAVVMRWNSGDGRLHTHR